MADGSKIEWTDATWSHIVGCTRVSEGCRHCYSERFMARFSGIKGHKFEGVSQFTPEGPRWTGVVRLDEASLDQPMRWKKPKRIFVNSISDTFHENVPDEWIDRIFAVMLITSQPRWHCPRKDCEHEDCPAANNEGTPIGQQVFQVLTKRPKRMLAYLTDKTVWCRIEEQVERMGYGELMDGAELVGSAGSAYLKNIWIGVSAEDQATADERVPLLLQTPAAVRWVSYEPALGPVDLDSEKVDGLHALGCGWEGGHPHGDCNDRGLDWIVVGGESGPGARPFDIAWARSIRDQCRAASLPVFVKQLGAKQMQDGVPRSEFYTLKSKKGGDWSEWPEDLRVREFPASIVEAKA